jgi:hypothetical protein
MMGIRKPTAIAIAGLDSKEDNSQQAPKKHIPIQT